VTSQSVAPGPPFGTIDILGIPVHGVTFAETVRLIVSWAREGSGGYVYTPNVDDIVKSRRLPEFRSAVLGARLRVPDGMGIVYGSRILGRPLGGTVTGRRLPEAIVAACAGDPVRMAFLGGRPGIAEAAGRNLERQGAVVGAALAPPMGFQIGSIEDQAITQRLRDSGSEIVFVSLGAPKQAYWMARHAADLPGAVLVGIGGGIDVLAGIAPAAPQWMTRLGVEWLFRLVHEPRRLARRYLIDDPRFFYWAARERLSRRRLRRQAD
jgi:N-acetylglucosaminyldiphosphoundecaprenol N-acetyl-beta-D-mannosaminyltransferase